MADMVRLAMWNAAERFSEVGDGLFNSANFSAAITELAGVKTQLDGRVVDVILIGRTDVEPAGCRRERHWRIKEIEDVETKR